MFYIKSYLKQMVMLAGRAVMQLHPALDLLHCRLVLSSVQMPQLRPAVYWVLLLGLV